jgi:hypothetical protein
MTLSDFRTRFPEFDSTPDATVQAKIDEADDMFDPIGWDDLLDTGMGYYVAHLLAMSSLSGSSPSNVFLDDAVSKKVGDIQKSRDPDLMQQAVDNPLIRTTYGQMYMYYRGLIGGGAMSV